VRFWRREPFNGAKGCLAAATCVAISAVDELTKQFESLSPSSQAPSKTALRRRSIDGIESCLRGGVGSARCLLLMSVGSSCTNNTQPQEQNTGGHSVYQAVLAHSFPSSSGWMRRTSGTGRAPSGTERVVSP
jgi:hypothetical protein